MVASLQVPAADIMTLSYGRLFENWKKETGSAALNLTFAEVAGSPLTAR